MALLEHFLPITRSDIELEQLETGLGWRTCANTLNSERKKAIHADALEALEVANTVEELRLIMQRVLEELV